LSASEINAAYEVISPLTIEFSAIVVDETLEITGTVTADMALSGDLKLRLAVAEQNIYKSDAPGGTNSEQVYHHVMKKFIGGSSGYSLDDMAAGDVYTFSVSTSLSSASIYNYDELEVVAFVQDDSDKTIYQAAKDQDVELTSSVGVSEIELNAAISIGPNPVNDILNVRINLDTQESVSLEVLNSLGQKVFVQTLGTINGNSLTEVDVKPLDAGIYYVNAVTSNATSTTKVTVFK
jgi:hypothetical protein